MEWAELTTAAEVGGATCSIFSYRVQWDQGNGGEESWVDLAGVASQYTDLSFLQTTGISSTNRYRFRVAAKNKHGFGPYSDVLEVLAAVVPSVPTGVTTSHNGLFSTIAWDIPDENGAAVDGYLVEIQGAHGFEASATCNGLEGTVVS